MMVIYKTILFVISLILSTLPPERLARHEMTTSMLFLNAIDFKDVRSVTSPKHTSAFGNCYF